MRLIATAVRMAQSYHAPPFYTDGSDGFDVAAVALKI